MFGALLSDRLILTDSFVLQVFACDCTHFDLFNNVAVPEVQEIFVFFTQVLCED